jgi:hypothetical protein
VKRLLQLVLLIGPICATLPGTAQDTVSARARFLHDSAIVIDAHEDTAQRFLDENYDIGSADPKDSKFKDQDFISLDKRAQEISAPCFFLSVSTEKPARQSVRPT